MAREDGLGPMGLRQFGGKERTTNVRGQRLSSWRSRAASAAPWFPDGTIQGDVGEGGASAADWAPGTEKAPFWEPSIPGAGAEESGAIVSCQFLFKVLTDRMLGSDSVG